MNPTTKTSLLPESIRSHILAENSPRVRAIMEHMTGRRELSNSGWYFDVSTDDYGNNFLRMDHCIQGEIVWVIHFWREANELMRRGELGLNPLSLFRSAPDVPSRIAQMLESLRL